MIKAFILTLLLLPTFLLAKNQDLVFKLPETNWHTDYETSVGEYKMTEMTKDGETIDGAIFGPMTIGENIVVKGFVCTVPIKNNYLKVVATAPLASFESELEQFKEVVKSIKPL